VGLGVAEDPGVFILKGQVVREDLTLEDGELRSFEKSGTPKTMTQRHIPAYPNLFLCCMGVISIVAIVIFIVIVVIIIIQDKIII
jgi:hypothetical protein